jgi:hypothetical protein
MIEKFIVYISNHEYPMRAKSWEEVASELYDNGYVNMGKVKVVKRTYQWVSDEPQLIDTDY